MHNPKRSCSKVVTAIAAAAMLPTLLGSEPLARGAEEDLPLMAPVVVTATRRAESVATVPASVTVVSQEQIARSAAETVPELLRTVGGVLVSDIAGNGRYFTVDLSGFGEAAPANTLVLIDGRRINQVDLSGTDWTLIPLDQVERIEIVRGSRGSVLYGDNAADGVINIITKKGKGKQLSAGIAAGSYDTFHSHAGVSGSSEHFNYALNTNYQESNGYRDNSGTFARNADLNTEYLPTDAFSIALSGGYHEDEARLPGALTQADFDNGVRRTASLHPNDYANTRDSYVQAVPQWFFTGSSYLKLDASFRRRTANSFISFSNGSSLYETTIDTTALSPQVVFKEALDGHTSNLNIGFDYNKSKWKAHNDAVFFPYASTLSAEMTKKTTGSFIHEEFSITDELLLSGGARHDRATFDFPANASPDKSVFDEDLYTAGITYRITPKLSAFASYSKNFRYPLLDELFDIFTSQFNTGLTSQSGNDIEAGTLFQAAGEMTLGLTLFRTKTENEIFYDSPNFTNANLDGDTIRQGVEVKASKNFSNLLLSASYTFRDTNIDGGRYDGKEVPDVPKHQFTVGAATSFFT
ncbi:MAG: TonB-dependent receptor, partial [Deltaproteobacteria bacterium]